jgi:hypothetical protein
MRLGTLAMGIGLSRASGLGAKGFLQRERRLLCAGLRTPATATLPHAPTAGVGNWPRDEIAEGGAPRVRLALWGFERARRDDGGGSAP